MKFKNKKTKIIILTLWSIIGIIILLTIYAGIKFEYQLEEVVEYYDSLENKSEFCESMENGEMIDNYCHLTRNNVLPDIYYKHYVHCEWSNLSMHTEYKKLRISDHMIFWLLECGDHKVEIINGKD